MGWLPSCCSHWTLIRLKRWSEYWCLPLNPNECETFLLLLASHQANQPHLLLFNFRLLFNLTPNFLGVTLDHTLSFSKHESLLKAKFFPRFKALRCISAYSWGPSKKSFSFLYKDFLRLLLTYASPRWFPFLSVTNVIKLERLRRATNRTITGCLPSSLIPFLFSEVSLPPLQVILNHFTPISYEGTLCLPISFPMPGLARLEVKPRFSRSSWRAFASTYPLVLFLTFLREFRLLAFPILLTTRLPSLWSPSFPLTASVLISPFSPRFGSCSLWLSPISRSGDPD